MIMVTIAQTLTTYIQTQGMPVTNHAHFAFNERTSHTVTPSSVSAAKSWLLAPNSAQNVCQTGITLPVASLVVCRTNGSGARAVMAVAAQRPLASCQPNSSWMM